jgi:hypothetical protein
MTCSSRLDTRGVSRSSRDVRRGCGGREGAGRRAAAFMDGEVVWSWRAHAGAKLATMLTHRADNGGKRWFAEEHEVSRKPLRREGRADPACTCGSRARANFFLRGSPGCSGHPAFPAPSVLDGRAFSGSPRAQLRCGNAKPCPAGATGFGLEVQRKLASNLPADHLGMIRTRRAALAQSGDRFSEKIMLKQGGRDDASK